jgi:hypothetical protein
MASTSIEQALYTYTLGSTAVRDAIGLRLYFAEAPADAARPYCIFNTVSDPHEPFVFGKPNSGQPRVQFSVFHQDRYSAITAAHVIRKRLRWYQGIMDTGIEVERTNVTGTILLREPDKNVYMATFDVQPIYIDAS